MVAQTFFHTGETVLHPHICRGRVRGKSCEGECAFVVQKKQQIALHRCQRRDSLGCTPSPINVLAFLDASNVTRTIITQRKKKMVRQRKKKKKSEGKFNFLDAMAILS